MRFLISGGFFQRVSDMVRRGVLVATGYQAVTDEIEEIPKGYYAYSASSSEIPVGVCAYSASTEIPVGGLASISEPEIPTRYLGWRLS